MLSSAVGRPVIAMTVAQSQGLPTTIMSTPQIMDLVDRLATGWGGAATFGNRTEVPTSCSVSDPGSCPQICVLESCLPWGGDGRVRRIGLRGWERVRQ